MKNIGSFSGGDTKTAAAYRLLRRAIVTGSIPDGETLKEQDLSQFIGFGRTPVREALKRLAHESFIVWPAQRSPYIRKSSAKELKYLTEARIAVEIPAARFAATRMSTSQLEQLEGICDEISLCQQQGKIYEITELDFQFHTKLALFSGNQFLFEAVSALDAGALRLWYKVHVVLGPSTNSHAGILQALADRNVEAVDMEIREHILTFQRRQIEAEDVALRQAAEKLAYDPTFVENVQATDV